MTERVVRMAYRGYLIELRLTTAARGRWQAGWSVFRTKPFSRIAHGAPASPHTLRDGAQAAATRGALAWIETHSSSPALAAAGA